MLIDSINTPVFAIEFSYPFSFPLLNIECVMGVHFLQDGKRKICDVVISLGEVLASGLADIAILNISNMFLCPCPKFTFCFPHILHAATSLEAGYYINLFLWQDHFQDLLIGIESAPKIHF